MFLRSFETDITVKIPLIFEISDWGFLVTPGFLDRFHIVPHCNSKASVCDFLVGPVFFRMFAFLEAQYPKIYFPLGYDFLGISFLLQPTRFAEWKKTWNNINWTTWSFSCFFSFWKFIPFRVGSETAFSLHSASFRDIWSAIITHCVYPQNQILW